jgi:superfamily I DNA and/or RNA helicase
MQENAIDAELDADKCEVVACTCTGAGDKALIGKEFAIVAVDEATQATEPSTLIPLTRRGIRKVLLVGDPMQLPPTVTSREAERMGLRVSLFEKLMDAGVQVGVRHTLPMVLTFPAHAQSVVTE